MSGLKYLSAAACVVAGLCFSVSSLMLAANHFSYLQVATELSFWSRDDYRPSASVRAATLDATNALLRAHPQYPDYLELAAYANQWEWYFSGEADYAERALALQREAVRGRPARRLSWRSLADYAEASNSLELARNARSQFHALHASSRYHSESSELH